jgi:hypothetical protein
MEVGHDHLVTPIVFEVTGSKVKVTLALGSKSLSAQLIKNALVNSLHILY